MLCFLFDILHFFISSKYDFHVDVEIMIAKMREKCKRNICVDGLKKITYGTIPLP